MDINYRKGDKVFFKKGKYYSNIGTFLSDYSDTKAKVLLEFGSIVYPNFEDIILYSDYLKQQLKIT